MLCKRSNIKKIIKEQGLHTSEEYYAKLDEKIRLLTLDACIRAKGNNRTTVMARDL